MATLVPLADQGLCLVGLSRSGCASGDTDAMALVNGATGETLSLPGAWRLHFAGGDAWLEEASTGSKFWAKEKLKLQAAINKGRLIIKYVDTGAVAWHDKVVAKLDTKYAGFHIRVADRLVCDARSKRLHCLGARLVTRVALYCG